jgi:putative ABC transport system permease protein
MFGAAADITGKTISLGGQNYTIVGVMPDEFDYPLATQVWVPLTFTPNEKAERDYHDLLAIGLLKAGVHSNEAAAELASIAQRLERDYPNTNEGRSVAVTPLTQMTEHTTDRFVTVLSFSALFVLLLAAANVANIQLARVMSFRRSIAIEVALGATRLRVARLLCVESVVLAIAGGIGGLAAATWIGELNTARIPAMVYRLVPGLRSMHVDSTVVLFTLVLSLVTGVVCSLPAIVHMVFKRPRWALSEALNEGSRTAAGDMRNRMRNTLVIGEVALSLLLLAGAGVMVNTFQNMLTLNLGYNSVNLLTGDIALAKAEYPRSEQIAGFFDRALTELSTIPNVKSASVSGDMGRPGGLFIEGLPAPTEADPRPFIRVIDGHYFETMQMPIVSGRAISQQDQSSTLPVVVVSRSLATHYWPDSDAVGHRIRFGRSPWLTVVGVCGDTMQWFLNTPEPAIYIPYKQAPMLDMRIVLRTEGDPLRISNIVAARLRALDPSEPVYRINTMEQSLIEERSGVAGAAQMMSANAVVALFLAVTGIYGVLAYFVSQRTKEIGVRIALGASTLDIIRMVLARACRLAGAGLVIGIPAAYLLMQVLSSALYNVVVLRWTVFLAATALLGAAALLAAYIPARRAAVIDPVVALRND